MTDMPVRQRVSTLSVNVKTLFIIQCHTPVTIIKTTYLLTYLLLTNMTNIMATYDRAQTPGDKVDQEQIRQKASDHPPGPEELHGRS